MRRVTVRLATAFVAIVACFQAFTLIAMAQEVGGATRYDDRKREANENTISIITAGVHCTCTRFADDMRAILTDMSPGGLRVLPMIGVGGTQNLQDLLFLKGVDLAVVDQDVFDKIRKKDPAMFANVNQRIHYIAKLYNAEFHVLARNDIKSFEDLVGKKVNLQLKNSTTAIAAESIFATLGIKIDPTYYDDTLSLEKMRDGELAAIAILTGAPRAILENIQKSDGFHFLPLDDQSLPNRDLSGLYVTYLPAEQLMNTIPTSSPLAKACPPSPTAPFWPPTPGRKTPSATKGWRSSFRSSSTTSTNSRTAPATSSGMKSISPPRCPAGPGSKRLASGLKTATTPWPPRAAK